MWWFILFLFIFGRNLNLEKTFHGDLWYNVHTAYIIYTYEIVGSLKNI